ncbi:MULTISPECIES: ribosome maturation factor RimM [Gracilibacillus]|uniref:ribosome maturation factor RimM n=1 Tax=Gracilibacillus TaxID=74385 RepID=UPI0008261C42|nr:MULTISPECIES: ribosome maturation factor RimM [Gracilibacillus]
MEYVRVGKIINTHGIKGEVKVLRITDFEERFEQGNVLWIQTEGQDTMQQVTIDGHRNHKNFDLLHFKGWDNINDVERLKNALLVIDKAQLGDLAENEFYYHEIIGCKVHTTDEVYIGKVTEILSPGANDVWVVSGQGKQHLIPYIEEVVKQVNVEEQEIIIEPMEGLLSQ